MADTSTKVPTVNSDDASVGSVAWSFGSGDVFALDAADALVTLSAGQQSHWLLLTDFGFAIPSDATIDGVEVLIYRWGDDSGSPGTTFADTDLRLRDSGGPIGLGREDTGTNWPSSVTPATYGSPSDLFDTGGISPATANSSSFGFVLSITASGGMGSGVAHVDYITLTIYYTTLGGNEGFQAVTVIPAAEWLELWEQPGDSFVGLDPNDGVYVPDVSDDEQGYAPAEIPGEWGEDGAGDWYATLPQGVEIVISSAVDSVPVFVAPLPEWEEVGVETYAIEIDPQTIAGATCECTGTLAFEADTFGTMAFDGVVTIEFETTEETGPFGTISAVDGCGTIAFDESCEC